MKRLPNWLSVLLLGMSFLCFFEKANAQCGDNNQYLMEVKTGKLSLTNQLIADTKGVTVFNRVEFLFKNKYYCTDWKKFLLGTFSFLKKSLNLSTLKAVAFSSNNPFLKIDSVLATKPDL